VRFDDPTVSRRHALIYRDTSGARVLDDRSLNGVFRNGDRVELAELDDGDEIAIGRFRLFFVSLASELESSRSATTTAG
jgi:pSer/pThr/pTyr-binding forkhead associated (FHA) protein